MQEKLYLYYTNDLHSNLEHWPRVANFMKEKRNQRKVTGEDYWLVDIGDHVDRVHPIAEAFLGKANVELMNDLQYDVATIGNNEGITLSRNDLFHLYDHAQFEVVCANLRSTDGSTPKWLKSTVIQQTSNGLSVGIIGLTAPFNDYYQLLGWHVDYPIETLKHEVKQLKQKADIIILLSHLGITEDQEIARIFKEIDVIIGGHTHHLLRHGEMINNTILTAAGKHCTYVGEVILTWDHTLGQLIHKEAYTTDISHIEKDPETSQRLENLNIEANQRLSEVIVHTTKPIEVKWFEHTTIMQQLTDTMREWTEADCGLLNSGVLVEEFPTGNITYKDVHQICPHPINPCVVELTGDELTEVVRASLTKEFINLKLKGFGFRGKLLGQMVFSGMEVKTNVHEDGQEYVVEIRLNGQPLDSKKTYQVVTADTFTFGRLLPEIARSEVKHYFLPEFLRDLLVHTLKVNYGEYQ